MADRHTAIRASQLRNFSITAEDLKNDSITGDKFIDLTISGSKIANTTVTDGKLVSSYVYADGTRALTADWDIGDGRMIQTDKIRARDAAGLALYDDADNGIFVADGGNVSIAEVLDLSGSNKMHQIAGHNFVQGDSTKTYIYGGTGGIELRKSDNSVSLLAITDAGVMTKAFDFGTNKFFTISGHNFFQGDATLTYLYGGTDGIAVRKSDNSSELLRISDAGDVGIGVSPGRKLDVNGIIRIRDDTDPKEFTFASGAGTELGNIQSVNEDGTHQSLWFGTYESGIQDGRMVITGAGNVGIGITDPGEVLDVNGSIRTNASMKFTKPGVSDWQMGATLTGDNGFSIVGGTISTHRLFIGEGGDIGIGNTAPRVKLDITSDAGIVGLADADYINDSINLTNSSGVNADDGYGSSIVFTRHDKTSANRRAGIFSVQTSSDPDQVGLAFVTHPLTTNDKTLVEQMRIEHNGKVGIGTKTPLYKLHVETGEELVGKFKSTDNTGYIEVGDDTKSISLGVVGGSDYGFINYAGGESEMFFKSGNVGIGTNSPTTKLEVNGGITETKGVLKQNLLPNSGFGVWSNSGLDQGTTGRQTDFEVGSDTMASGEGDGTSVATWIPTNCTFEATNSGGAGAEGGDDFFTLTRTAASTQYSRVTNASALTIGKLYKATFWVKSGTSGNEAFGGEWHNGSGIIVGITGTSSAAWADYSFIFEAKQTLLDIRLRKDTGTAGTMLFDTVSVFEVTPGCVGANTLAFDGWEKSGIATCKIYREHQGTNTKDGSFYSLRLHNTANVERYVRWPLTIDDPVHVAKFEGRTVTLGCWVKTSIASGARIQISTNVTNVPSSSHTGSGDWEWLEITDTIQSGITFITFYFVSMGVTADETAYFSHPMLVFGNSIGEGNYSERPTDTFVLTGLESLEESDGKVYVWDKDRGMTNTNDMVIDSSGNVGIGTTTPGAKLELGSGQIFAPVGSLSAPSYSFTEETNGGMYAQTNPVGQLAFASNGIKWLTADGNGVGIGLPDVNANARLDIYGTSATGNIAIKLNSGSNGVGTRLWFTDGVTHNYVFGTADNTNGDFVWEAGGTVAVKGTEKMRLTQGGSLGIGTTTPNEKLSVIGTISGSSDLIIDGDVGIGETSPDALLTIGDGVDGNAFLLQVGGGAVQVNSERVVIAGIKVYNSGSPARQLTMLDTTAQAAGVGGGISFAGKYTNAGTNTTFASIEGAKENSIDGNYAGNLVFKTRPHGDSSVERVVIDSAGLVTVKNGIVEENGVLKQNLLTNSGFGVWSNSTLENVDSDLAPDDCATSLVTEVSGTTGWTNLGMATFESSNTRADDGSYSLHIVGDGGNTQDRAETSFTTVVGKLYRIKLKAWVANEDADTKLRVMIGYTSNANQYYNNLDFGGASWTELDMVVEAETTSITVGFKVSGSNYDPDAYIDSVSVYEVTPGVVNASAFGPDGWGKRGTADNKLHREHKGSNTKSGSFYSLKQHNTENGENNILWPQASISALEEHFVRFAGRAVTFGAWVKTSTASEARINILDSGSNNFSSFHTGSGDYEWLEVTITVSANPTQLIFYFISIGTTADETIYWAQPKLVFGNSIGEGNYAPIPQEIIWLENKVNSTYITSSIPATNLAINLEADSNGAIPKGVVALYGRVYGVHSGSTGKRIEIAKDNTGLEVGYGIRNQVSGVGLDANGWAQLDSNGDYYLIVTGAMTSTSHQYLGVQMR